MPRLMTSSPADQLKLPLATSAAGRARRHAERWLANTRIGSGSRRRVVLVVSEFVTNAVTHALSAPTLLLWLDDGAVVVAVDDDDPTPPHRRRGGSQGGYGLGIVEQLADRWGWTPTMRGKRVWARVSVDDGPQSPS